LAIAAITGPRIAVITLFALGGVRPNAVSAAGGRTIGIATVTVYEIAIIAGLVTRSDSITADRLTDRIRAGPLTGPARRHETITFAPIGLITIPVITPLGTDHQAIPTDRFAGSPSGTLTGPPRIDATLCAAAVVSKRDLVIAFLGADAKAIPTDGRTCIRPFAGTSPAFFD